MEEGHNQRLTQLREVKIGWKKVRRRTLNKERRGTIGWNIDFRAIVKNANSCMERMGERMGVEKEAERTMHDEASAFVRGFRSRNPRWKLTLRMPRTALGFQEGQARVVATPHREVLQTMSRQTWLTLRSVYYRDNPATGTYRVAYRKESLKRLYGSSNTGDKKAKRLITWKQRDLYRLC